MDQAGHPLELSPEALRRATDPATLEFDTTEQLPEPAMAPGQERALAAMEMALGIASERYNLFVMGEPGSGRTEAALEMTREVASKRHPASDWVYAHNFVAPEEPLALEFPAGRGRDFAKDVETFVTACRRELRRAFSSEGYTQRRSESLKPLAARRDALLEELRQEALARGFVIQGTPAGLMVAPLKPREPSAQGAIEIYSPEEFQALPDTEKQRLQEANAEVEAITSRLIPQTRAVEDEMRARLESVDHEIADNAIRHLADDILITYNATTEAREFLEALRSDIVAHAVVLRESAEEAPPSEDEARGGQSVELPLDEDLRERPPVRALLRRYSINVMVTRQANGFAPVIEETNPTYANLMGRIDIGVRDGLPFTDHMMLRPGAIHRAVGGYLILQARDLITTPRAWEAVKRLARFSRIELENGSLTAGSTPGSTIRPQPIRADVKIILIGDPTTYVMLSELDPEFGPIFKVRADFDVEMPRDPAGEQAYARIAGAAARALGYPPLTSAAVAAVIEEGSRWAEDQRRLSTKITDVGDLCVEAGYFARAAGAERTDTGHVEAAINARERRNNLLVKKTDAAMLDGLILIGTSGAVVGQINGLSVREVFGHAFGAPNRITARVSPGMAGVVTVERETAMSGPSHTKGVLVLSGYLSGRFAQRFPLSLSASLCFEQLYGGVDGDSASSAELYALLSALADAPINQALAVTGSVNQRGEVQAIGGVTQKTEGFFRICKERGLTGEQGVLIPAVNARNLMLRKEVIEAVRAGQFHIYGVTTIEEGIQILTGIPFGTLTNDGRYLTGTIAERVLTRLTEYSARVQAYSAPRGAQASKGKSGTEEMRMVISNASGQRLRH
jgi:predicted ATP-dependent protease